MFKLVWICIDCFCDAYPHRALGLTSRKPQECFVCGCDEKICVMFNNTTAEEVKQKLKGR